MKRVVRMRINKLPGARVDGMTHSVLGGASRNIQIGPTTVIEVPADNKRAKLKRPLDKLVKSLAAVNGVASLLPKEAAALGRTLGQLMWEESVPELDELWIETDDAFIAGLPWPLAAPSSSSSLMAREIPVVVQVGGALDEAGLPVQPKLLFLAPHYRGNQATRWQDHLLALRTALEGLATIVEANPASEGEIAAALRTHAPDIVYYFGHGVMKGEVFQLDLGDAYCPADRLAAVLSDKLPDGRLIRENVGLLYLNCCWGAVSTQFGGPFELAGLMPCFISNRAAALNDVAQRQARDILTEVLGNRTAPHEAVHRAMRREFTRTGEAAGAKNEPNEPWWLTLTVFARYGAWRRPPPRRLGRILSFEETLEVDRHNHWSMLDSSLRRGQSQMQGPRIVMAVWHGESDDGLHSLGERLSMGVLDGFRACHLATREVAWPAKLGNVKTRAERERLLAEAIGGAVCGTNGVDGAVARRARDLLRPASGVAVLRQAALDQAVLAAERHDQLEDILLAYASVLAHNFDVLTHTPPVLLVALLRIEGRDAEIARVIRSARKANKARVEIVSMPALDPIGAADIEAFLQRLAGDRPDVLDDGAEIAAKILAGHQGRYEPTRGLLAKIEEFL